MMLRRVHRIAFALAATAVVTACAPTAPSGGSAGSASVAAAPAATAAASSAPSSAPRPPSRLAGTIAPDAIASASPSAAPTPTPTLAPTAAPTATPAPAILAPNARPEILDYTINTTTVHPGGTLSGTVWTSSNVASVEVRVAGYSVNMRKVQAGEFTVAYTVPNIPPIFRKTYPMVILARNARGDATQRTTAITIR